MNKRIASLISTGLLAAVVLALFGCGTSNQQADGPSPLTVQPSRHKVSTLQMRHATRLVLPDSVRAAVDRISAPVMPAAGGSGKGVSVVLPYNFPAEQQYAAGDAGWIAKSSDVVPGGLGGMDMGPTGTSFPDNLSYIIYRIDDIVQPPGRLSITLGLALGNVGIAIYDWAYGSNGRWEPIYYGDASVGNLQGDIGTIPGADWTNANDDMAIMFFCINPDTVNVSTIGLEESQAGNYDEVENNDSDAEANPVTLPFSGFLGNVGDGGAYDGDFFDTYSFTANPGDTVTFEVTYPDTAADAQDQDGDSNFESGMLLFIVDQEFWDSGQQGGLQTGIGGSGGNAHLEYTFDGSETGPFYCVVVNGWSVTPVPPTDYTLLGNPGSGVGYDETENNDGGQANYLEDLDLNNSISWLCSFGSDITYPGYDGDSDDWFAFADIDNGFGMNAGDVANITIDYDSATADIVFDFYAIDGTLLTSSPGDGDGSESISYVVTGTEVQPFFINVRGSGFSDYTLTGTR